MTTANNNIKTVEDLAKYAGISTDAMIDELIKQSPDINWKPKTAVPQNLVDIYTKSFDEYKEVSEPIGSLAPAESNSIQSQRITSEANQYALTEAIAAVDMRDIISAAIGNTFNEIHTYQETRAQVWREFTKQKIADAQKRQAQTAELFKKAEAARQAQTSASFRDTQAIKTEADQMLEAAHDFLAKTLNGL